MVKILNVAVDGAGEKLLIKTEEFPDRSWIFDMNEITDINDFKVKLLDKEQGMKKQKQLIQGIQTLIDDKTEISQ